MLPITPFVLAFVVWQMEVDQFFDAVGVSNLPTARRLIEQSPELIHTRNVDGKTPLHLAVGNSDKHTIEFLIQSGANVNDVYGSNTTALHLVKNPKVAQLLIDNGADPHAKTFRGATPIQRAVSDGNNELVDVFLNAGATLDFESMVKLNRIEEVSDALKKNSELAKTRGLLRIGGTSYQITKLLLENGADPNDNSGINTSSGRPYTPLSSAIGRMDYHVAKLLLQHGADVDVEGGKWYDNAFYEAVARCDDRMVGLLVDYGADINSFDHRDITPLHLAAEIGEQSKVELLLDRGAKVNATTPGGATPLQFAAYADHEEIVSLLLDNGAELDVYSACALGITESVRTMLASNPELANERDDHLSRPPLFWAVESQQVELVKLLLDHDATVDIRAPMIHRIPRVTGPTTPTWLRSPDAPKYPKGETPINLAAKRSNIGILRLLIEHGADINALDEDGHSPLLYAISRGRVETVKLLFEQGADLDNRTGAKSPLVRAYDNPEILKLLLSKNPCQEMLDDALSGLGIKHPEIGAILLEHGAEPDIYVAAAMGLLDKLKEHLKSEPTLVNRTQPDYPRMTPLTCAINNNRLDSVKVLVSSGASINPNEGTAPVFYAAKHGHLDIVKYLMEKGANVLPLRAAAENGHVNIVRYLLQQGTYASETSYYGTALHTAALHGHLEVVQLLVENEVDVDSVDRFGETPLHKGVWSGSTAIVRYLLLKGASANKNNFQGNTPLHEAAFHGRLEIVSLLLSEGAEINALNWKAETPVDRAEQPLDPLTSKILCHLDRGNERDRSAVARFLRERGGVSGRDQ